MTLEQEQEAFDAQVDQLLPDHAGKFVLFKDGAPVAFFDDHVAAYEAALERYGLDATFLIAQVVKANPQPVSIAWEAGVMFGES